MHAHIYIQCTRGGWDEIFMYIEWKKEEDVMYVDGGRVMVAMNI